MPNNIEDEYEVNNILKSNYEYVKNTQVLSLCGLRPIVIQMKVRMK